MKFSRMLMTIVLLTGIATAKETTTQIKVSGMTCGACAVSVKAALTRTKGVKSADVSTVKGLATVVYDDTQVTRLVLKLNPARGSSVEMLPNLEGRGVFSASRPAWGMPRLRQEREAGRHADG